MTAAQLWFLAILATIALASLVWCLLEARHSPIDPPWGVDWFDEITAWREDVAGRDHWDVWEQEMAE